MRSLVLLLSVLGLSTVAVGGDIHAVLVAGSNGWWNYRHQADVFHAYQVLKDHGVKAENIITLAYDDIANDYENPFPGKVFNQPNGQDVYQGVKIDYKGEDVTPENFMAILTGNKKAVSGGNGRVLKSTSADKVFIFFSDHGAPGLIAFPWDELTVKQLNSTLQNMIDNQKFAELVFYLETCESGSMFEGVLPNNVGILAVTAANATESSWGCYCDDPNIDSCLGDLFSVNWMQDSDVEDLSKETLQGQYVIVKAKTDASNVMQYGNLSITSEIVANFQGHSKAPSVVPRRNRRLFNSNKVHSHAKWASREIPLKSLEKRLKRTTDPAKRAQLTRELEMMKLKQQYLDEHTRALVSKLVPDVAVHQQVMTNKPTAINEIDCHHDVVKAYSAECFNLGQNSYALNAVAPLANLCESGIPADHIVKTIKSHCAKKNVHMTNIV
ncbi:Legumain [Aphelenchoides besseyi]|nr:Legumain [Aphelenchoides besseyi]KAI6232032.1 Legumain [Aphelenchoides besseyi]